MSIALWIVSTMKPRHFYLRTVSHIGMNRGRMQWRAVRSVPACEKEQATRSELPALINTGLRRENILYHRPAIAGLALGATGACIVRLLASVPGVRRRGGQMGAVDRRMGCSQPAGYR